MSLQDFFAENVAKVENMKFAASERIQSKGKPALWEIRAITANEDAAIRQACTKRISTAIKGQTRPELDTDLYGVKLAAACTVYPDLKNAELQNSYGVMGEVELLRAMLTIGELNDYMMKVQEINGFTKPMDEMVEEAKN